MLIGPLRDRLRRYHVVSQIHESDADDCPWHTIPYLYPKLIESTLYYRWDDFS